MTYKYSKFGASMPKQDTRRDINTALLSVEEYKRTFHAPIVTASFHSALPGTQPTPTAFNALLLLQFSLNNDAAFRQFKIPDSFVEDPKFHIHWTKTSNANESTKTVRWRVSYAVFNSTMTNFGDGAVTPTVVEVQDTYDDAGTTTRLVHRTADMPLVGFEPGYYVSLKIEAITPTGTAMASAPGLYSVDLTYSELINS